MRGEHEAGRWESAVGVNRGRVIPVPSFTWVSEDTGVESDAGLPMASSDFFLLSALEDSFDSLLLGFLKNQHHIMAQQ